MEQYFDIGLIGLAGSGKNAVGTIIVENFKDYSEISFADTLKYVCAHHFKWDGKKDEKGRKLLQTIGMALREYNPDSWVNITEEDININKKTCSLVYTDVRFPNEAAYIKKKGGVIVRVVRPSLELTKTHEHVSESSQAEIKEDYTIVNDGSLDDLKEKVFNMMKDFSTKMTQPWLLPPS